MPNEKKNAVSPALAAALKAPFRPAAVSKGGSKCARSPSKCLKIVGLGAPAIIPAVPAPAVPPTAAHPLVPAAAAAAACPLGFGAAAKSAAGLGVTLHLGHADVKITVSPPK